MSEIIKTDAVVLSKLSYGDTSSIVTLYTETDGKLSAIVKGGRSSKSKIGKIIDPINYLQIIIYKKNTRDIQILSDANLISHFINLKEDLNSAKYGFAVIELIKNLTVEHEVNQKLFKGLVKILNLINDKKENPAFLFGRFLLFFLSELGYELSTDKCSVCGNKLITGTTLGFDFNTGILCSDCFKSHSGVETISAELFDLIFCLKTNRLTEKFNVGIMDKFIFLMEQYLRFHITGFKGIQSFRIYK
ncbi:MAG: DNA repair protein RecO [Ignavibacterium sp.]|jgi:DNA repair protein RecO (recombination protein O)|nr:DNA repair protein RecO [Ignavibacterium sp.]